MPLRASVAHCVYTNGKDGYISGCGFRAAYNKFWKVCPYCTKPIHLLINGVNYDEDDEQYKERTKYRHEK